MPICFLRIMAYFSWQVPPYIRPIGCIYISWRIGKAESENSRGIVRLSLCVDVLDVQHDLYGNVKMTAAAVPQAFHECPVHRGFKVSDDAFHAALAAHMDGRLIGDGDSQACSYFSSAPKYHAMAYTAKKMTAAKITP